MTNIKFDFVKKIYESNIFVYLFFLLYLTIGLIIFNDYGISLDEPFNRMNGLVSLKYIVEKFSIPLDLNQVSIHIPDFQTYVSSSSNINIIYGVVFDLPLALIEVLFNLNDTRDIYLIRHLFNFLVFFISTICFYHLINFQFKNKILSLIGVLLLILSPRIFAQSFYNSKDIIFLSLMIFAVFFNIKLLNYNGIKYIFLASFFSALATALRIPGCYIPIITVFFYSLNYDKNYHELSRLKFFLYYFSLFLVLLYLLWPFLWEDPLTNFLYSFKLLGSIPYSFYTLYLGDFVNTKHIPWHYFFVWFFISTPPFFLLIIICGFFISAKNFFVNISFIEEDNKNFLWKNNYEMNELFILCVFIIPVFLTILLGSTVYNGWRHFFFIYPALIFLGISALKFINTHTKKIIIKSVNSLLVIQIFFVAYFIVQSHPLQSIYFNSLSKKIATNHFVYDYWGLGNRLSLEKLINDENYKKPIKIATSSFTDLNKTKFIIEKDLRDKLIILGTEKENADFIFTNYYYNTAPNSEKKFLIPDNYHSIIRLEVNGLLINEIFKKK